MNEAVQARVLVGTGRYADPWHDFPSVGARVGSLLAEDGFTVETHDDVDASLADLAGVDLLVVCAGDPWGDGETGLGAPRASAEGLRAAIARGIGILGMHAAVASLRDYADWAAALGGVWIPGSSTHPPLGTARVHVADDPITAGLPDFALVDERYSFLQPLGDRRVLAWHELDGVRHPLAWVRGHGASRVAYDALAHRADSLENAEHAELVRRLARWAVRS